MPFLTRSPITSLRTPALLLSVCCLLLAAGCVQNTVRLVYAQPVENAIPAAGAAQVTVVQFTDERGKDEVGVRSNGSAFTPSSSVAEWLSRALASDLARQGMVVTFAASETQARASGAKHVLTGSIQEVWLKEESATSYACTLRASLLLKDGTSTLVKNSFTSTLERKVMPLSSVPQEMLSEGVADLVRPMAAAVRAKIQP